MADGVESFDEVKNLNRVKAGMKGGKYWSGPANQPSLTFVEGYAPETIQNLKATPIPQSTPIDTWKSRR